MLVEWLKVIILFSMKTSLLINFYPCHMGTDFLILLTNVIFYDIIGYQNYKESFLYVKIITAFKKN